MPLFLRVHFLQYIFFTAVLSVLSLALHAQEQTGTRRGSRVIDDTTKQVYGPNTSKYYFEKDVFFNRVAYHPIDTGIHNFHRYTYVQANENFYQDLGNIGTALNPIYYQAPEVIGASSGFNVYNLCWDSEPIKYYDTKSTFTNMKVVLGGRGRSITRATYSRNINPRWNFGFTYRGLFIDKQVQRQGKGDRNVLSNYYDFYTAFQSKDSTYRLFFNFRRNNHQTDEYGGIQQFTGFEEADYYDVNANPSLTEAVSQELRINVHLFHQYQIGKGLQFYHVFDRFRQGNDFLDYYGQEPEGALLNYAPLDRDTVADHVKFRTVRNEVGIKGNLLKLFYNGYYAIRDYRMDYKYIPQGFFYNADTMKVKTSAVESYLGGRMSLKLDSLVEVTGWAEVMNTGNYRIDGFIKSRWFEASLRQMQYAPSFVQQAYQGAFNKWNNDFSDINVTQLNGYIHYNSRVLNVSPGLTFTRLGNYVFFKEDDTQQMLPMQSSGEQVILSPELKMSLTVLRHIRLSGQGVYTKLIQSFDDAIQLPKLFVNAQLAYENIFFNGNLDMHAGVDVHWKSTYYAQAYDVPVQQFYVQQTTQVQSFPLVDVFFSAKIKRGRIFFKYNNLIQAFTKEGYIITPNYPGQRNILDFGFDWSFYD